MAFTEFETSTANISGLSDRPNQNDGLSSAQLKGRFDKAGNDIKTYINDVLLDELARTTDGDSGADNIGATAVGDGTATTVQGVLEELADVLVDIDASVVHKDVDGENITGLKNFIGSFNVVSDNNNLQGAIGAAGDALYLNASDQSTSPTKSASLRIEPSDEMNALLFKGGNDPTYKKVWHEGNDGTGSGLDADKLDGKQDADMVHIDGTETITGTKTFSTAPVVPTPTADGNPATKKYADDIASARYTKTNMKTSGQALLHWDNLTNVPNLADNHWKTPVANQAALPVTGNALGDNRVVLDDGDGKQAVYTCVATTGTYEQQWSKVGDVDWMSEEQTRITQENARQSSEGSTSPRNGRIGAELNRVDAELNRVDAENARVNAEGDATKGRVKAENDRVVAEGLRQVHINDEGKHKYYVPHATLTNHGTGNAEGQYTTASGYVSHAEGYGTTASGNCSHAEGNNTTASGSHSHAEGVDTTASGAYSHAEGHDTTASGTSSHAQNRRTIAQGKDQTAIGEYNIPQGTTDSKLPTDDAFIIGNGTGASNRSNALSVKWNGDVKASGEVEDGAGNKLSLKADKTRLEESELDLTQHKLDYASQANIVLNNSITNGNFANGTTGWTGAAGANITAKNNTLSITGVGAITSPRLTSILPDFPKNKNIYFRGQFKITNQDFTQIELRLIGSSSGNAYIAPANPQVITESNKLYTISSIIDLSNFIGNVITYFEHNYATSELSNGKTMEVRNLLALDLTATFGAGNEPTKVEMDTLVSLIPNQWWDGELRPSQKLLLNWQLKLIRQNRNAIVALGGTII